MIDMPPAHQSAASLRFSQRCSLLFPRHKLLQNGEMVSVKMLTMGDPASVFSIQSVFHRHMNDGKMTDRHL